MNPILLEYIEIKQQIEKLTERLDQIKKEVASAIQEEPNPTIGNVTLTIREQKEYIFSSDSARDKYLKLLEEATASLKEIKNSITNREKTLIIENKAILINTNHIPVLKYEKT